MVKKEMDKVDTFPLNQQELEPLLGNFVIQFERIMEQLRYTILLILQKKVWKI